MHEKEIILDFEANSAMLSKNKYYLGKLYLFDIQLIYIFIHLIICFISNLILFLFLILIFLFFLIILFTISGLEKQNLTKKKMEDKSLHATLSKINEENLKLKRESELNLKLDDK